MQKAKEHSDNRDKWLRSLKQLVERVSERESHYSTTCPLRLATDSERQGILVQIAEANKAIAQTVRDAISLEDGKTFGVTKLVEKPDDLTATVLLLAVAARLHPEVSRMFRRVGDYIGMMGRDPVESLKVRNLFRSDSAIYPFIALGGGVVLDERTVVLKERATNLCLGNRTGDASEVECDYEIRNSRRW